MLLEGFRDWNVEGYRVHDAQALELHPDAVHAGTRKGHVELDVLAGSARRISGGYRMVVRHVREVGARGQHVAPGTEVRLHALSGTHPEHHRGILPRDDMGRRERELDTCVLGRLR